MARAWRAAWTTSCSSRSAPASAPASCCGGELHRGHHGAAGELDGVSAGLAEEIDPCAEAVSALAARLAADWSGDTALAPPFDPRAIFAAARAGDPLARA